MIYHEHKCIFVHVPKTAGLSIATALGWCPQNTEVGNIHLTLKEYRDQNTFAVFMDYFKFAIVRNPFDRLVSYYHYFLQNARNKINPDINFHDFITTGMNLYTSKPQMDFLTFEPKEIGKCDFIGRYENLENDWKIISKTLGIDKDLLHINKSQHDNYKQYYTPELKKWVYDKHLIDFETFNYTF